MKNRIFIISLAFMLLIGGCAAPTEAPAATPSPAPAATAEPAPETEGEVLLDWQDTPELPAEYAEHFPALPYGPGACKAAAGRLHHHRVRRDGAGRAC